MSNLNRKKLTHKLFGPKAKAISVVNESFEPMGIEFAAYLPNQPDQKKLFLSPDLQI